MNIYKNNDLSILLTWNTYPGRGIVLGKTADGKQSVAAYVKEVAKANGANIAIKGFIRFETGEGIEKKEENFAEEVAKQIGGN